MNKKPILLLLFIVLLNAQSLATHDCKLVANPLNLEIPNFETGTLFLIQEHIPSKES